MQWVGSWLQANGAKGPSRIFRPMATSRENVAAVLVAVLLVALFFGWRAVRSGTSEILPFGEPAATLRNDPAVEIDSLPNGLRFYIRRNGWPERSAELRLVVNAGSVLEEEGERGLAHVVEHMAFRGTERFPGDRLVAYLQSLGMRPGTDLNAYTAFDETVYRLTIPLDDGQALERGFAILADWAHRVRFDSADVARERRVVFEEWRQDRDAGRRLYEQRTAMLLGGSRYAQRAPIGDTAVLARFTVDDVRRFYRRWYRPDLMAVVAVGDFPAGRVRDLVERYFAPIPRPDSAPQRPRFEVPMPSETKVAVLSEEEATRTRVALWRVSPVHVLRTRADMRREIAREMLDAMFDARLAELSRRSDAPLRNATTTREDLTRGLEGFVVHGDVAERGILEGLQALATETRRVQRHGFTAPELERQRRAMLRQNEQELTVEELPNSSRLADAAVHHYLRGEPMLTRDDVEQLYADLVPAVRLEEVNALAKAAVADSGRVLLVTTRRRDVGTRAAPRLLEVLATVDTSSVPPWQDPTPTGPLIAKRPEPGRIVSQRELASLEMTEWMLSNGMRVLLKPTSNAAREVLFVARAPGGASLAGDDEYVSAYLSDRIIEAMGVGAYDARQLERILDATTVSLEPHIDDEDVSLRGSADFVDLVTLFQLAHLYFTAPRADTAAFESMRRQLQQSLRGRGADPDAAFRDTVLVTLGQHHPRELPPSEAMYEKLDLEDALQFYRERTANAANFTVIMVGSFVASDLRDLVERYLGSLPAGKRESARDAGSRYPRGVVERRFARGADPKAVTRISFVGSVTPTQDSIQALHLAHELVSAVVEGALRDSLGGTYGVDVDLTLGPPPRYEYALSLEFTAAPERLDSLVRAA
ncbi:MAG TPA: insulinase family protein, partial [Solirubrobacter sp.]|nr:insulinase family protein [Solirubrobacter sp.]